MHLAVTISAHGFGHAAQSCAVLNAMAQLVPELQLTIVSQVDPGFLAARLTVPYQLIKQQTDIGLVMHSGIEIDLPASRAAYYDWHAHWPEKVAEVADLLASIQPDALLCNIAYTPLAAARQLGIPAVALCCLSWATVYRHYFADAADFRRIHAEMVAAYHQANAFLTTPPVWHMPEIDNQRMTALLAQPGHDHRDALRQQLKLAPDTRLMLIGLGGVATRLPMEQWPQSAGYYWLVPESWAVQRPDVSSIESTGMAFSDLVASVDGVLGKMGYGLVSECAVNATPLLYIERPDWPEDTPFSAWLNANGRCAGISKAAVLQGDLYSKLDELLSCSAPVPPVPDAQQVARDCLEYLYAIN